MIPSQRDAVILNLLERQGVVSIEEIRTYCDCSRETARRDLRRLAEQDLLVRTHGGALRKGTEPRASGIPSGGSMLEARVALVDRSDVLIITPSGTVATRLLVERAKRAGVPVVAEAVPYPGTTTTVCVDDYQAGMELGLWVADYARRYLGGRVSVLDISLPQANTEARSRGFADGMRGIPSRNRTIYHVDGQGLRETARQIAAEALILHPDIQVILGINDDSALGGWDAIHQTERDESQFLIVWMGLEGDTTRNLLVGSGPFKAAVAMFPEAVGHACADAALCTYNHCPLPERILAPFVVVTGETLPEYYTLDPDSGEWQVNWASVANVPSASPHFLMLQGCKHRSKPSRISYVHPFGSHEWYQTIRRVMRGYTRAQNIALEIVDASQDVEKEISALKQAIGREAAHLVHDGDTILLDGGDTVLYLAQALRDRQGITVITNSVPVLQALAGYSGITLISCGGVVYHESKSLVGYGAEASLRELRADKVFVSATGVSRSFGVSVPNVDEAAVKQAMIAAAREAIVLADYTKIGVESLVRIAPLQSIACLVTNGEISAHDRAIFTQLGIEVIIAGA